MKKIFLFIICGLTACATVEGKDYARLNERLNAENRLMKNRLAMLERENSVYRDENLQYKRDLQQLRASIEKLQGDLASLNEHYKKDIALRDGQLQSLTQKNEILAKESSQKIQELTQLGRDIELKLGNEIKRLNEEMARQQGAFNQEREAVKNENARKEFDLGKIIDDQKKLIIAKDTDNASLKTQNSALVLKFDEAVKALARRDADAAAMADKINELGGRLDAAMKDLDAKNSMVLRLQKQTDELNARIQSIAADEHKKTQK